MTNSFPISVHEGFCQTYEKQIADLKKKIAEGDARVTAALMGALNDAEMRLATHRAAIANLNKND